MTFDPIPSRAVGSVMAAAAPDPSVGSGQDLWSRWSLGRPVAAFRTARSALAAVLRMRGVRRLWLPAYSCAVLADAGEAAGCTLEWFGVGRTLEPETTAMARVLAPGDAVLAIDYFGRPPGEAFRAVVRSRPDVLWIEDRAQALATGDDPWGELILYSPRKLLGLGDGGLVVGDSGLNDRECADDGEALAAPERARAGDPDGDRPDAWFPLFQAREAAFATDDAPMSRLTRTVLRRTAAEPLIAARRANYAALLARLGGCALWPDVAPTFAPLAFPIVVPDRDRLAARLARQRIWCAKHWATLPSPADRFPTEHSLAASVLSLPCDHRYGAEDMARVADAVLRALA